VFSLGTSHSEIKTKFFIDKENTSKNIITVASRNNIDFIFSTPVTSRIWFVPKKI
jgi:hypothetical protein